MTRTAIMAAALALATTLPAVPAQAGAARTFVSAAGSDANNCTNVATPCRHMAAAFAATAADGEIYVLDPANYGSLTITHGVSIEGHGWASIAPPSGGNAITINANAGDKINIIGVVLDGTGETNHQRHRVQLRGQLDRSRQHNSKFQRLWHRLAAGGISHHSGVTYARGREWRPRYYLQPSGNQPVHAVFNRIEAYRNDLKGIGIFPNALAAGVGLQAVIVDSIAAYNRRILHHGKSR